MTWTDVKTRVHRAVIGPPRDPLAPETRQHITLIAFLAWVGLGADGLSSSTYGPEHAFRALGEHTGLALLLALATIATVFIIALSYRQVIELFPTGGGAYRVASRLLSRRIGLVAGAALIVDYVLTIAISLAAGADAMFSSLPEGWHFLKPGAAILLLTVLMILNLRGVKESIYVLLPIFLGFVVTHLGLIIYGIGAQAHRFDDVVVSSLNGITELADDVGILFVIALFIRAYGIGGGTYTGIEAVSNAIHLLKEPRVRTGKLTMLYVALSLAATAGGTILLYLLWNAQPAPGQTLNAVTFEKILGGWYWGNWHVGETALIVTLLLETGLLFVAANAGFIGGPATLANMAVDHWVPHRCSQLSDRLVTKNGVLLMGGAALGVLLGSRGEVGFLVVVYSISVFLTFSLTLLGLTRYWWRRRRTQTGWRRRLLLTLSGLSITVSIFLVLVIGKFSDGGWLAVLMIGALVAFCYAISQHYRNVRRTLASLDEILGQLPAPVRGKGKEPKLQEGEPAAAFFVSDYRGVGIHTLLNAQRLFPDRFKNFVFLSTGVVDTAAIKEDQQILDLQKDVDSHLDNYVRFCRAHGMAATSYSAFGIDPVAAGTQLAAQVLDQFPNSVFFAGTLIFRQENLFTRLLHNHTAYALQQRLHLMGVPLIIMPMRLEPSTAAA
ncbi:MAG: APC family permease [Gammaproteobacteria bacterium]